MSNQALLGGILQPNIWGRAGDCRNCISSASHQPRKQEARPLIQMQQGYTLLIDRDQSFTARIDAHFFLRATCEASNHCHASGR